MKDALILFVAIIFALLYFIEMRRRDQVEEKLSQIHTALAGVARWCDWHFPMVGYTCDHLINVLKGKVIHDNRNFRDELFKAFGERQLGEEWELTKKEIPRRG